MGAPHIGQYLGAVIVQKLTRSSQQCIGDGAHELLGLLKRGYEHALPLPSTRAGVTLAALGFAAKPASATTIRRNLAA